jgi:hypothetical protein
MCGSMTISTQCWIRRQLDDRLTPELKTVVGKTQSCRRRNRSERARRIVTGFNASDLLRLQRELYELDRFKNRPNLLRALGAEWSEPKHSNFLSFLLDPSQRHQLGDRFLKALLIELFHTSESHTQTISRIAGCDLTATEVRREWKNIDILLLNPQQRIAIILENKTLTGEHDDQLRRYWDTVATNFPWASDRQLGILLSVQGIRPSYPNYVGVSYAVVCAAGERLLRSSGQIMPEWTRNYVAEYVSAIRREFVGDPQILDVVWKINLKFREALDFVNSNKPNSLIRQKVLELVKGAPQVELQRDVSTEVAFCPSRVLINGRNWQNRRIGHL